MPHASRWFFGCLLLLISGCGGAGMSAESTPAVPMAAAADAPPPAPPGDAPEEPRAESASLTGFAGPDRPGPLLIYDANVVLAVYEVEKSLDAVEGAAQRAGGYLVSRQGNVIVVRIPASGFDTSLKQVLGLGDVLHRELHVEDVTAKVRDLEARMKNAEAVRQRLVELLAGAKKTDEALAVEKELGRVTEELERMQAQLKRLRELVAYSTLTVRFEAPQAEALDRRFKLPFPWLDELGLSRLLSM